MASSPSARSLALLRDRGYMAQVVERWNPFARVRHDLFGVIDVLAIRGYETVAVQSTSYANVAARVRKIQSSDALFLMVGAGWHVWVHGWHKRAGRWVCREVQVLP